MHIHHWGLAILATTMSSSALAATGSSSPSPIATARFAGAPLDSGAVTRILAAAGETDPLLSWHACEAEAAAATLLPVDGCVAFTVGRGIRYRTYALSDVPCPTSATAGACYGGYLVSLASTTDLHIRAGRGAIHIEQLSGLRFTRAVPLWTGTAYVAPSIDDFFATMTLDIRGTSFVYENVVTNGAGDVVTGELRSFDAAAGSLACADIGLMAGAFIELLGTNLATSVAVSMVTGGALLGGTIAGVGTGVSLGTLSPAAVGAGVSVFGGTVGLATMIRTMVIDQAKAVAKLVDPMVREGCEFLEAAAQFEPDPIDLLLDPAATQGSGGGFEGTAAVCSGSLHAEQTTSDGALIDISCERAWGDGHCKWFCVEFCVSGCSEPE